MSAATAATFLKFWRSTALATAVAVGPWGTTAASAVDTAGSWDPWFEVGGYYNSRDYDALGSFGTSRGETTLFAPIGGGSQDLAFAQLTAKFFQDDAQEGNLAFGYRRMLGSGFNLGAWIGADVRNTEIDNRFWQMSAGLEVLSNDIDLRANWYGPVTDPKAATVATAQAQISGNQIFIVGAEEVALKGVDAEIGARLPLEWLNVTPQSWQLRAYGGAYYFDHSEALAEIAGAKGRLELRINDILPEMPGSRLTTEYEITYDKVRDTRHELGLRLRIPLGTARLAYRQDDIDAQRHRMLDAVERDTDIVTTQSGPEAVEDALTGTDLERVAYASSAQSVTAAAQASGSNSLLIVNGTITGQQTVLADQTIVGGGTTIQVRGLKTGMVLPVTAPGQGGQLTAPMIDEDSLVLMGSNTHVAGLTIVGSGPAGVGDGIEVSSGTRNIYLRELMISQTGGDGVDIDNNSQVFISNLTTSDTDESGIDINDGNVVSIMDVSISNTNSDGIQIDDRNSVSIVRASLSGANGNDGIKIDDGNSITISDSTIRGPADDGIELDSENWLTVTNSTISDVDFGIFAENENNQVVLMNATLSDLSAVGLFSTGDGNQFFVRDSLFHNIDDDVFVFDQSNTANFEISGTEITGNVGLNVFLFRDGVTTVSSSSVDNTISANLGGSSCVAMFGSFTGSIGLSDGTSLIDNVLPCN